MAGSFNRSNHTAPSCSSVGATRQLRKGANSLIDAPENREVVISLREIAANKVSLDEDVRQQLEEGGFLKKITED